MDGPQVKDAFTGKKGMRTHTSDAGVKKARVPLGRALLPLCMAASVQESSGAGRGGGWHRAQALDRHHPKLSSTGQAMALLSPHL